MHCWLFGDSMPSRPGRWLRNGCCPSDRGKGGVEPSGLEYKRFLDVFKLSHDVQKMDRGTAEFTPSLSLNCPGVREKRAQRDAPGLISGRYILDGK
jgi:hypothetical protein